MLTTYPTIPPNASTDYLEERATLDAVRLKVEGVSQETVRAVLLADALHQREATWDSWRDELRGTAQRAILGISGGVVEEIAVDDRDRSYGVRVTVGERRATLHVHRDGRFYASMGGARISDCDSCGDVCGVDTGGAWGHPHEPFACHSCRDLFFRDLREWLSDPTPLPTVA
ncbi:Uncharacterised protein [Mycobacteroides abscessus]|uniref:hypothetical protein n=1 Tax=Mycobacteroides abscessus TaxID=36809 RepID=UPI0005DF28CF|nr:hypothetical protein [Mycobacteroides abscessus]CPS10667.1 Uncharacterised protein [Mycobacteroides abscessus]CPS50353.1 Uncharacterised protein [Mycobacteroides abscessus]CPS93872.1 Uncharacterised protein [Mycobacteroides abscessus]CPS94141.1 Uncharacterised protein [Mycobacteroides abscessus]CPT61921.1 Uncharacterised protein [Mycobacteroides abscessus]